MTSKEANQEVEIARCHRGQYFGELALVTNKPRAASAYAVGEVKCLGKQMFCVSSYPFLVFACFVDHAWVSSYSKPSSLLVTGGQTREARSMGWSGSPRWSLRSTTASFQQILFFLLVWPVLFERVSSISFLSTACLSHTAFRWSFNASVVCLASVFILEVRCVFH